jgi:5'-phosphate synthase pdxT subunit
LTIDVGVLALQGAVREHVNMINSCGGRGVAVKKPEALSQIDALIIPGGESTTIGKLVTKYDFEPAIKDLNARGVPLYGTCAGLILLAKSAVNPGAPSDAIDESMELPLSLGLIDLTVRRNAFGRQRESFEANLDIPELGPPAFSGVFIRAPLIESVGREVKVLARFEGKIVMARSGKILVTAFHPELTKDARIHKYFLRMVKEKCKST